MSDKMEHNRPLVLLVDDDPLSLDTLRRILEEDFEVRTANNAVEAQRILVDELIEVIVSDQRMPDNTGVELLTQVRERWPQVIRIIISGYTDPQDIIEGVNQAGIYQFIAKPWSPQQLILSLNNATRLYQLQQQNELLARELKHTEPVLNNILKQQRIKLRQHYQIENVVRSAESPMNKLCQQVLDIASFNIPVLITGESGTGKELIARALHYNSQWADKPFVTENCGAMPVQLLESELFGHKKGAFTGAYFERVGILEKSDGGTVFLDEIGEVSLEFQVKLLRFIQEGEIRPLGSNTTRRVNVRIVCATNRNLEQEVRAGRFREDLYYRLSPMPIHLPPLRDRSCDIEVLANSILQKAIKTFDKEVKGFTPEAMACLQQYHWPGNIRELQNEIAHLLILTKEEYLEASLLSKRILVGEVSQENELTGLIPNEGSLKARVENLEAKILRETLIRHRWNKSRAAKELELSRVGLRAKLDRYGVEPKLDS
jgi:two-component system response regulator HupR/HoxA